jgi:stage 0 sporulation protein B (sporulation initiation phosphotransferase)
MSSDLLSGEQYDDKHIDSEHALSDYKLDMDVNLRMIRLFDQYRHDWMNEIQLLFGYVKLKKYDKLEGLMENIRVKVQRESYISKLGTPELIVYLFSFQAEVKELILEIEMEQEINLNKLQFDCDRFCRMLIALIEAFKRNASHHTDGEHGLSLRLAQVSDRLEVRCTYQGDMENNLLQPALEQVKLRQGHTWEWKINQRDEHCLIVNVEVPLTT